MARDSYDLYRESLERKRAPALAEAERLVTEGRFDEADRAVLSADDSIYGEVALARLYRRRLEALVAGGVTEESHARAAAEAVFARALHWARSAYPEPHTQFEADDYAAGRVRDHAELVQILGYDPSDPGHR